MRMASILSISLVSMASLGGVGPLAGHSGRQSAEERGLPFPLTRNSVCQGAYVPIGDLRVVSKLEANSPEPEVLGMREELQRCIDVGPDWVRWSEDGTSLEVTWGPTSSNTIRNKVLTAYCRDDIMLIGGYSEINQEDGSPRRAEWLFEMVPALQSSPTKSWLLKPLAVGPWAHQTRYVLNELRSIDAVSGQMVFSGTSDEGERALLSAPFAVSVGDGIVVGLGATAK